MNKTTVKFILTLFALLQPGGLLRAQWAHQNIGLLSVFNDTNVAAEPVYGIRYQGCWGWANPQDGREYGIIGSTAGTFIIDVTDPTQPLQRDYIPGRSSNRIWHEYRSYQNYLYIISDGGHNSLQIADMSYLPDSVHLVYDDTTLFDSGHTLFIEGDKMYVAYVSKTGMATSSMSVYSLSNPTQPVLLRRLDQDFPAINTVHDMYVTHDTIFASCANQGLYIFRYNDATNRFTQLGSLTSYPDAGYNHSSFLDASHQVLYMCDEVPDGMAVKVIDVTDLSNMTVVDTFYSHIGATPHNPYVLRNELFLSYYQDGIVAYNLDDPRHPVNNGYFDTHYQNPPGVYPYPPYQGCWGAYTDLPSGHLLASDMQLGLFVLDISQVMSTGNIIANNNSFTLFPNPSCQSVQLTFPKSQEEQKIGLFDQTGRMVLERVLPAGSTATSINTADFCPGVYRLTMSSPSGVVARALVISN